MPHVKSFDGLKGIAILFIILYHLWPNLFPGGFLAVNIFLVLGAYFLTLKIYDSGVVNSWFALFIQFKRTVTRLFFPMIWLVILLLFFIQIFDPNLLKSMRTELLFSLLFVNNYFQILNGRSYFTDMAVTSYLTHLWYVAIYLQSFILTGTLVYLSKNMKIAPKILSIFWLCVFITCSFLTATGFQFQADPSNIYYGFHTRYASFAIGVASYYLIQTFNQKALSLSQDQLRIHYFFSVLIALMMLLLQILSLSDQEAAAYMLGLPYSNIFTALFIIGAGQKFLIYEKLLGNKVFAWLGKRSYSLYLCYYPLLVVTYSFQRVFANHIDGLKLLSLGLIIFLSAIFYYLFESNHFHPLFSSTLSLKKKLYWIKEHVQFPIKNVKDFSTGITYLLLIFLSLIGLARSKNDKPVALFDLEYGIYTTHPNPFSSFYKIDQTLKNNQYYLTGFDQLSGSNFSHTQSVTSMTDQAIQSFQADSILNQIGHLSQEKRQRFEEIQNQLPKLATILSPQEILYANELPLTLFGDSVAQFIGGSINQLFDQANAFGYVSLNIWHSYDKFQSLLDQGLVKDNLVINLGTNGGLDVPATEELIKMAGQREIYLVNSNSDIEFLDQIDQVIQTLTQKYSNVHLVDWRAISSGHPEYFREDDIHPSLEGAEFYLIELAKTVYQNRS
ncbi:acyltransferase family protein [Facklamia miroungae]|uniref:Peptidoglycan/LPS O-acetylase OafA/YrhL, contains acyltransferase and SGNH-hydrolase domains n=1 Tax=Facklamia miroungae TaxID=120956 RepID=A0A1G7S110_9LACT|nr:acyltransferase family protein [Facklamia miroungae]NKZ29204.1 acyltransferase [Facklamia miroungae]SDG16716.1 Peptidoglycan/LPS O-acetylase OafA/YrhL, contains acyltransferase and SGNH-hydrolase domains [Facklamia miroungae]